MRAPTSRAATSCSWRSAPPSNACTALARVSRHCRQARRPDARPAVTRSLPHAPVHRRKNHARTPSAPGADNRSALRHRGRRRPDLGRPRPGGGRSRGSGRPVQVRREAEHRRRGQLPGLHGDPGRRELDRHGRQLLRRHPRYVGPGRQAGAEVRRHAVRRQGRRGRRPRAPYRPRPGPGPPGHRRHRSPDRQASPPRRPQPAPTSPRPGSDARRPSGSPTSSTRAPSPRTRPTPAPSPSPARAPTSSARATPAVRSSTRPASSSASTAAPGRVVASALPPPRPAPGPSPRGPTT